MKKTALFVLSQLNFLYFPFICILSLVIYILENGVQTLNTCNATFRMTAYWKTKLNHTKGKKFSDYR